MLVLVQIDLSDANLELFDQYERCALALLSKYGATLEERVRSVDDLGEVHLLRFPDGAALDAFRADPERAALQDTWDRSGAVSTITEVLRIAS